jgi:hypothetical protein
MKNYSKKPRCGVDEKAAPFSGRKGGGSEVPRAGSRSDIVAASHHSKRRSKGY